MGEENPDSHVIGDLKKLSTPWKIALERANRIKNIDLGEGFILDLACGSGIQLAAYSFQLNKPCIGIEINSERAEIAKKSLNLILNNDFAKYSKIIIGDSLKKSEIKLDSEIRFSLIHLDPARPTDIQSHTLSEMQPPPIETLNLWKDLLIEKGAIILDLSPRLSKVQCKTLQNELAKILPNYEQTWEWSSQGRGRVDRLSVWLGSVASKNKSSRYVRNHPQNIEKSIIVEANKLPWDYSDSKLTDINVNIGDYISIIDPALISSGLEDIWLKSQKFKGVWIRKNGRRPLFVHSQKINHSRKEEGLIFESGIIRSIIKHDINEGVDPLIEIGNKLEMKKLTLRLKMMPELQPKFQSKLDKNLIDWGGIGFVIKLPDDRLAVCTKI
tara:strand:+ start:446 stop:1600 length:1155 start_codon:yes stop_codon:yes gene_type:complete